MWNLFVLVYKMWASIVAQLSYLLFLFYFISHLLESSTLPFCFRM